MTTTPTLREAAQQALEALKHARIELNIADRVRQCAPLHDAIDALRAALAEQDAEQAVTDDALRAMWRAAGGKFHGPIVETGTMPEALLLPFLRSIISAPAAEQAEPVVWECKAGGLKKLTQSQYDRQRDVIKQYYSRIETPAPARQEWQPIETAPKDGTRVLVYCRYAGRLVAGAAWRHSEPRAIQWEAVNGIVATPTHWQPLPAAPITAAPAEGGAA